MLDLNCMVYLYVMFIHMQPLLGIQEAAFIGGFSVFVIDVLVKLYFQFCRVLNIRLSLLAC